MPPVAALSSLLGRNLLVDGLALSLSHASSTLMILPCTRRPLSFSTTRRAWSGSQSGPSRSMCTKVSRSLTPHRCGRLLTFSLLSIALSCLWCIGMLVCSMLSVSNTHLLLVITAAWWHTGVSLQYAFLCIYIEGRNQKARCDLVSKLFLGLGLSLYCTLFFLI